MHDVCLFEEPAPQWYLIINYEFAGTTPIVWRPPVALPINMRLPSHITAPHFAGLIHI